MFRQSFAGFRRAVRELMICGKRRTAGGVERNGSTTGKKNIVACGKRHRWRSSCLLTCCCSIPSRLCLTLLAGWLFGSLSFLRSTQPPKWKHWSRSQCWPQNNTSCNQHNAGFTSPSCSKNHTCHSSVGERHSSHNTLFR